MTLVQSLESKSVRQTQSLLILTFLEVPVQRWVVNRAVTRAVLVHQVDIGIGGDLVGEECEHRFGAGDVPGQYQVAHQQASLGDALFIQLQVTHLAVHLPDRSEVCLNVVTHVGIRVRQPRVTVFHVGHVDINYAVEQGQGFGAVIAAGVVDQRDAQTLAGSDVYRTDDLRYHVTGGDEVDVVTALSLQYQHHPGQLFRFHFMAQALLADLPVLAEDAAQAAPGKEEGARAVHPAQWVFFTVMRAVTVDPGTHTGAADRALDAGIAIDVTVTGAQVAIGHVPVGLFGACLQLVALQQGEIGGFESVLAAHCCYLKGNRTNAVSFPAYWAIRS